MMIPQISEKRLQSSPVRDFRDGEVIFSEGDESTEMFVIQKGEVVISKRSAQGEIQLAVLKKGDFFGEMALLESLPRTATARVRGSAKILSIQSGGFLLKIRRDPTFAFEMLQKLSHRLRSTNEKLMQALNHPQPPTLESLKSILQESEFNAAPSSTRGSFIRK